jgi:hypothetical protein
MFSVNSLLGQFKKKKDEDMGLKLEGSVKI